MQNRWGLNGKSGTCTWQQHKLRSVTSSSLNNVLKHCIPHLAISPLLKWHWSVSDLRGVNRVTPQVFNTSQIWCDVCRRSGMSLFYRDCKSPCSQIIILKGLEGRKRCWLWRMLLRSMACIYSAMTKIKRKWVVAEGLRRSPSFLRWHKA